MKIIRSPFKLRFPLFIFIFLILGINTQLTSAQDRGLTVLAKSVSGDDIQIGKQYAVLIAVDKYQEWPTLRNPVKDAQEIKAILQKRYFIDEFIELYNQDATSSGIRKGFSSLVDRVGPTDSVLLYYAGHGYLDKFKTGFWIPVDGGKDLDEQNHWIPNAQIKNFITQINARSVVLVSDSCFSGDLLNVSRGAEPTLDSAYFRNALHYTAKQVLTSGASETVPDESEFARQFKSVLQNNTESCLDPLAIYDRIRRGVTQTEPLLGTLPGNEIGGSYVLFLRETDNTQKVPEKIADTSVVIKIQKEQQVLDSLKADYSSSLEKQKTDKAVAAISFISGGVTGVAAGVLYFLGNSAMTSYQNAATVSEAQSQHSKVDLYNTLFITSSALSVSGLSLGSLFLAITPKPQQIDIQVNASIERLQKLQAQKVAEGL